MDVATRVSRAKPSAGARHRAGAPPGRSVSVLAWQGCGGLAPGGVADGPVTRHMGTHDDIPP